MAADDVIASPPVGHEFKPTVRFYTWQPSAVSLGVHQRSDAVDHHRCKLKGWDVVRRPTGGRALLHDRDLSYSVILSGGRSTPQGLKMLYESVALAWIETFRSFGLESELVVSGRGSSTGTAHIRDGLCLDSRVRGELIAKGKKITAAAQRIYPGSVLQHGSVTLQGDVAEITHVLPGELHDNEVAINNLRSSAGSIKELFDIELSVVLLTEAAIAPFSRHLGMELIPDVWGEDELKAIKERQKFHLISSSSDVKMNGK